MSDPSTGSGQRHTPPIEFAGRSFVLTTDAEQDHYFDHIGRVSLPAAVHVAAGLCGAGAVLVDVGANMGLCTLPFSIIAGESGRVVAVEPGRRTAADLRRSVQLNDALNITVLETALGDAAGEATLIDPGWNASAAFISQQTSGVADVHTNHLPVHATTVRVQTLDTVVDEHHLDRIDLLKIDVEGFESKVLAGATRTISRFRPPCVIEFNPFTLAVMASENPLHFLTGLATIFPFVAAIDDHLNVEPITNDHAAYSLVHRCFLRGQICDLICSWTDYSGLFGEPRELFSGPRPA
jgi:FkbM family methyltransferase